MSKWVIQSYLFDRKKWDLKEAQMWVKTHRGSTNDDVVSWDEEFSEEEYFINAQEFEQAPYRTNDNLPANVKKLPFGAQTIWRKSFNASYPKGEDYAFKVAWSAVKRVYFKNSSGKWVRKSIGELENSFKELQTGDLIELQKLDILGKQSSLLDTLIKNNAENQ
jgi:cation transport regulator